MIRIISILLVCVGLAACLAHGAVIGPDGDIYRLHTFAYSQSPILQTIESPSRSSNTERIKWYTYGGIGAAHLVGAVPVYNHLTDSWGAPTGKFHFKNETADYLAFNDEVSHLFDSYKLAQGFEAAYRSLGFSDGKARLFGTIESAFIMTFVEIPIDAFNPSQGMGVTDLAADYLGIGLAWWKSANPALDDLDLKVSMRSFSGQYSRGLGENQEDYDNYIYWLTYRYKFAVAGVGYGTTHPSPKDPDPSAYLGIGTTIPDLVGIVSSKLARNLKPLELYFFNFHIEAF